MVTTDANKFFLEGFSVQLSEKFHEEPTIDPLLQCLSDVDFLISKLDTSAIDHTEQFKNNMVHIKDNITINGTIILNEMNYSQTPVIDTVKVFPFGVVFCLLQWFFQISFQVLYNFSEEFKSPQKIKSAMKELELAAKNISMELPSLLYVSNSSYTVSA